MASAGMPQGPGPGLPHTKSSAGMSVTLQAQAMARAGGPTGPLAGVFAQTAPMRSGMNGVVSRGPPLSPLSMHPANPADDYT